jgi:predicted MPP superfamily phosphohydrolase
MKALPVIVVLALYAGGNVYVFQRLWQVLPCHSSLARWGFIAGASVLVASLALSFLLEGVGPSRLAGACYAAGTTWLFVFLYLLMATVARDLLHAADGWWHVLPSRRVTYVVMAGVVAAVLVAGHARYLVKERVELTVDTGKGVDAKMVFISDLHLGYNVGDRELERWVALVNAERPDVVLIGGDVVDNSLRPLEEGRAAATLRRLEARWGVHACPGNHEYIAGIDRAARFLERAGVHLLRDTVVEIGGAFRLAGRDDRQNRHRRPLHALLAGVDRSLPLVVLDHQPYHLEEAVAGGVDLQLSGHTHRGQVWPVSWITDLLFEVSRGYRREGNTSVYVTSGLGLWGGKFRVGTRSEYVVIHLR